MPKIDLSGARITLMGLGSFGGALGAARWLLEQGADLCITDLRPASEFERALQSIQPWIRSGSVDLRLGGHNVSDFTQADLIVANPAVPRPWENRFLRAAEAADVPITSEIRLLVERLPDRRRVVGVTGTAGKSTTASMIHHVLARRGQSAFLGGNLGGSLLEHLDRIGSGDWIVLELSSAQLHWLSAGVGDPAWPGWSPACAVLTNIAPNHLDWHGSMEHYVHAKHQIFRDQRAGDVRVVHAELVDEIEEPSSDGVHVHAIDERALSSVPHLRIPGAHNRLNAAFAIRTVESIGAEVLGSGAGSDELTTFAGLPHRLELVGEFGAPNGARFRAFNDSKCTTPEGAALAIDAFSLSQGEIGAAKIHLICGGYDKQVDLAPLVSAAAACASVWTIGATGLGLTTELRRLGGRAHHAGELPQAVEGALAQIGEGDVLLLAPGCASWDQFKTYEERGEEFARLVARSSARREVTRDGPELSHR